MSEEPSNAASEFLRSVLAFFMEAGSPPEELVRGRLTDDFAYEDRRSGPSFPDADAESFPKFVETIWETGADGQPRFEVETIAVRGERFAAVAVKLDYGNGMLFESIRVFGLDATLSLAQRARDFDRDDVRWSDRRAGSAAGPGRSELRLPIQSLGYALSHPGATIGP